MQPRARDTLRFLALLALLVGASGCAARRTFVVQSDPPGALLRIDDRVVGVTPYEERFDAYGKRRITLYLQGYRTVSQLVDIDAPWYGRFPADIVSEVLLPVGWRDRHEVRVTLEAESGAVSAPDFEKVLDNAESLRLAGPEGPRTLPPRAARPVRSEPELPPAPTTPPPENPKPPQL